ncbi:MAG: recombinase family protein [Clostridiales bacterium]|nr:recombinase family protein [Clostridiales bacterium]
MIYGYCRISRNTQNIERQVRNILSAYPEAKIYKEAYTGTKIYGRKEFNKLIKIVAANDTIVFDSVSRMSRNADEGIQMYFDLLNKGINLIFLKEHYIDTDVYEQNTQDKIPYTGTDEDLIFEGLNKYFKRLAEKQIRIAFEQAQKEVDDLHQRTKEGIETARQNGKQIGQKEGAKLHIKKKEPIKAEILKKSKSFKGSMTDSDLLKVLCANAKTKVSRNVYYKYKKELADELKSQQNI